MLGTVINYCGDYQSGTGGIAILCKSKHHVATVLEVSTQQQNAFLLHDDKDDKWR